MSEVNALGSDENTLAAGEFLTSLLRNGSIQDAVSQNVIPTPVKAIEIRTGLMTDANGAPKESLHFKIEGGAGSEMNQAEILKQAEALLKNVPTLATHFSFSGDTPTPEKPMLSAHSWRDETTLDIKFDLPAGEKPAAIVKEILTLAHGANLAQQNAAMQETAAQPAAAPEASPPAANTNFTTLANPPALTQAERIKQQKADAGQKIAI